MGNEKRIEETIISRDMGYVLYEVYELRVVWCGIGFRCDTLDIFAYRVRGWLSPWSTVRNSERTWFMGYGLWQLGRLTLFLAICLVVLGIRPTHFEMILDSDGFCVFFFSQQERKKASKRPCSQWMERLCELSTRSLTGTHLAST